ncbi:DUF2177 family protein [Phaeovulum sp. W22_SRMD_FR3]|uniref:DUF2177 family protein n=1 Tax=Phaeovulum sp. W22_SRMD_FR3 TaxID=3240274 RepID=UPI003F9BECE6
MAQIVLFLSTAVVFLALDAVMLTRVMHPLFARHLGAQLLTEIRMVPAVVFYLGYVLGILVLVSWPALRDGLPLRALWRGAVLGAMAYGTYELTSYTIMRDWQPSMVAVDLIWGSVLTGISAWAGVQITRALIG